MSPGKPLVGDRIRLVAPLMWGGSRPGELDPSGPPVGTEGTVTWVNTWKNWPTRQFGVDWDNGTKLMLLGEDPYVVIGRELTTQDGELIQQLLEGEK